tara:strand:+ start:677 stop:853 length:177 start_codon:yes stop_codon:yes gene_type:complete
MIKKIINLIKNFFIQFKKQKEFKNRINSMKKKDPFVYWSEDEWNRDKLNLPKIKKDKK